MRLRRATSTAIFLLTKNVFSPEGLLCLVRVLQSSFFHSETSFLWYPAILQTSYLLQAAQIIAPCQSLKTGFFRLRSAILALSSDDVKASLRQGMPSCLKFPFLSVYKTMQWWRFRIFPHWFADVKVPFSEAFWLISCKRKVQTINHHCVNWASVWLNTPLSTIGIFGTLLSQ